MYQGPQDTRVFTGVMDQDSAAWAVSKENYRYALNLVDSFKQIRGSRINIAGNTEVINADLKNGTNKCLGYFEDIAGNSVIFFVYNSFGYHGIFRWFEKDSVDINGRIQTLYQVLDPSLYDSFNLNPLDFKEDSLITGVNLSAEILSWTDKEQPKSVNIQRINRVEKQVIYNIYLSQKSLEITTSYNIWVSTSATTLGTTVFTITLSQSLLSQRCEAIALYINTNYGQYLTATTKYDYVEVKANFFGDFFMKMTEDNAYGLGQILSKAVPQNIYPDYRIGFVPTLNYRPLEQWHTLMAKSPPFAGISTQYVVNLNNLQNNVYANIIPFTGTYTVSAIDTYNILPGSSNDSTSGFYDYLNEYTLGATVAGLGTLTPLAFFTPVNNSTYKGQLVLDINVTSTSTTRFRIAVSYANAGISFITGNSYVSQWYTSNNNGALPIDFEFTWQSQPLPVYPIVFIQWDGALPVGDIVTMNIRDGFVRYWNADTTDKIDLNTPYQFRAKYVYQDDKNSVYNFYSKTPLPVSFDENSIEISLSDKWLNDPSYVAMIKNVVLAYSDDAGLTWKDFVVLNQNEFVTNTKYYFYGREYVRQVPESEAILHNHAVPVKAYGQEFIDQRIFYSGITEGYDLVPIDLDIDISYYLYSDPILYPTQQQADYVLVTGSYGSFWERGYRGQVGVVYMDDYDRSTFVNVCDKSNVVTKFWSQNTSAGLQPSHIPVLSWALNNNPPDWATKYCFVRQKNTRTENFLEWSPLVSFTDNEYNEVPYQTFIYVYGWSIPGSQTLFDIQVNGVSIMYTVTPPTVDDGNFASVVVAEINAHIGVGTATEMNGKVYIKIPISLAGIPTTSITSVVFSLGAGSVALYNQVNATYVALDFGGVGQYDDKLGAKLEFTYVKDDFVIFKTLPYEQWPIRSVDGSKVYIDCRGNYQLPLSSYPVQVYTSAITKSSPFYEFGDVYEIYTTFENGKLRKYHRGLLQDQTGTQPATGQWGYGYGNVWYRDSIDPDVNYQLFDYLLNAAPAIVQRQSFCDFTDVVSDNNGRVNSKIDKGQVFNKSAIRFSDPWIQNTSINGINAFQPANYKQYNVDWGIAIKLQRVNNDILKVLFTNSAQNSIYVNQGIIRQAQGAGNIISLSDQVIGDDHVIQRTLGTVNPESVVVNDEGDMIGWDENEGVVWMSSGNGLLQISDRMMKNTFMNYSLHRRQLGTPSHTPAVYDLYNDMYIITLGAMSPVVETPPSATFYIPDIPSPYSSYYFSVSLNPAGTIYFSNIAFSASPYVMMAQILTPLGFTVTQNSDGSILVVAPDYASYENTTMNVTVVNVDIGYYQPYSGYFNNGTPADLLPAFNAVTLVYSKPKQGWVCYMSYTPEMYGRLRNKVIAFKDGKLYLQESSAIFNNFFGVQYQSNIRYVLNNDYPKVKVPLSVWYRGVGGWGAKITNVPSASYPYGQETEMTPAHFLLEEDGYYAPVMKNKLDPHYPTQDQAWVNGEDIRGDAPEVEWYNNQDSLIRMDSTKTLYLYSENS